MADGGAFSPYFILVCFYNRTRGTSYTRRVTTVSQLGVRPLVFLPPTTRVIAQSKITKKPAVVLINNYLLTLR